MAITISGSGITSANIADGTITTDDILASDVKNLKSGRKNLIINGGFDVWQRGTSFSNPATNDYLADRWLAVVQSATVSKESITDLPGFSSALKLTTGATDPYFVQKVEGTYFRGQTMTFSFWVKGDIPPHTMFYDYTNTYSAQTPILMDTVGAWKRYSNTYVLPTTAPTQDYLTLRIDLAESSSSIQYLTGVQAELGSVATDFEHRSYGEELALCQRYYWKWSARTAGSSQVVFHGLSSGSGHFAWHPPVIMRDTPTIGTTTTTPYWESVPWYAAGTSLTGVVLNNGHSSASGGEIKLTGTFSPTLVRGTNYTIDATTFYFDAEL